MDIRVLMTDPVICLSFQFVALYDYDPFKSSPNQNPAAEMSFKEGDILKVFNTFRKDGYFVGKVLKVFIIRGLA